MRYFYNSCKIFQLWNSNFLAVSSLWMAFCYVSYSTRFKHLEWHQATSRTGWPILLLYRCEQRKWNVHWSRKGQKQERGHGIKRRVMQLVMLCSRLENLCVVGAYCRAYWGHCVGLRGQTNGFNRRIIRIKEECCSSNAFDIGTTAAR